MNEKEINAKINESLSEIYKSHDKTLFDYEMYGQTIGLSNEVFLLDEAMRNYGLIKIASDARMITPYGIQIQENGGWLAHLSREAAKSNLEKDRLKRQDEKLKYDARISEYLYKTRWWPLIISLLSLAIAIMALLKD